MVVQHSVHYELLISG